MSGPISQPHEDEVMPAELTRRALDHSALLLLVEQLSGRSSSGAAPTS